MPAVREISAVLGIGLRSIPSRGGSSMIIVIGVAIVVTVFIAALAVAIGFERVAAGTGHADRVMVIARDAPTESASGLSREVARFIADSAGIRRVPDGAPVVSAESLTFVPLADARSGRTMFVTLRGVGPHSTELRPEVRVLEGRMFMPGARELIVGRAAQERLRGLALGSSVTLTQGEWTIVGVFGSGGDSHESELLADVETVMSLNRRNDYNSMTLALESPADFDRLAAALRTNPIAALDVMRESDYFARASRNVVQLLRLIAFGMGAIMAIGAAFGALNAMYTAVSARSGEIAVLRAVGFGSGSVVTSVLLEALLLSMVGALLGALLAWALFSGASISTISGSNPSQVTFSLQVTLPIMALGVAGACAIGLVGGVFPAARAGRDVLASALRQG